MQKRSIWKRYRYLKYLIPIIPSLILFFTFCVYPSLQVIPLSFFKWYILKPERTFVGLKNFIQNLRTPVSIGYLKNTLFYILFLFVIQSVLSVLVALALHKNTLHNRAFRTFFFLPLTLSSVLVGLTWGYMYDPNLGILNHMLTALGIKGFDSFAWLGTPTRGILFIVLVHIWQGLGYPITFFIAGLHTIPNDLYEAADVEGASPVQAFFHITVPLMMPIFLRLTMLTLVAGATAFDYVYLLGSNMSISPTSTWAVALYKAVSGTGNMGAPSSMGVMLGVVLSAFFIIQYFATKKAEEHTGR